MHVRFVLLALPTLIVASLLSLSVVAPASASTPTYSQVLASLTSATAQPTGYSRAAFGDGWIDVENGCDTRAEVLKAESLVPVTTNASCTVETGQWLSWYDNATWTNASDVDIDHLVPLGEAWASGAYAWTAAQRLAYANDLGYDHALEAITDNVNQSKGDKDPAGWLPQYEQCRYAQYWVSVKDRWNLSVDTAERAALAGILTGSCGSETVADFPTKAGTPVDPTPAKPLPTVQRYAGSDRYGTAVAISSHYAAGVPVAYIATGTNYPDALSAAPAAAAQGGPLLLTATASVPANVQKELKRLQPKRIVVVGGTGAVSAHAYAQLKALASSIVRYSGADRYATSRMINTTVFGSTGAATVFVTTGQNFPDALTASAVAGGKPGPVVLVAGRSKSIDAATRGLMTSLRPTTIDIAGGTGVVSSGIETSLKSLATTHRYAGADRYLTSQAINTAQFGSAPTVYFATGTGFADALAGAALAARDHAPLYVVPSTCVPQAVISRLTTLGTTHRVLLGGTGALSSGVENLKPCATPVRPKPPTAPVAKNVTPGAYCSPVGARGLTSKGTAMLCGYTTKSPTRARWHAA